MVNNKIADLPDILTGKSENNISRQTIEQKKQFNGRTSKEIQFKEERKQLLETLLNILEINSHNTIFYIEDINNSDSKQQKILQLVDDIKKYFAYGNYVYFCKRNVADPCTSLSKSILKDMNIKFTTVTLRDNDTKTILKHGFRLHI